LIADAVIREDLMQPLVSGVLAAVLLTSFSGQALATNLMRWWNDSYYCRQDQHFGKLTTNVEKKKRASVERSHVTNMDFLPEFFAALTAAQRPDRSYRVLFDPRGGLNQSTQRSMQEHGRD
jgi:hypothetical protein